MHPIASTTSPHTPVTKKSSPNPAPAPPPAASDATATTDGSSSCPSPGKYQVTRRQRGQATYYGDKFTGRKTASGERYQPNEMTAAHRTLPFGTRVRVKRLDGNGEVVCVRINDRGPFGKASRIIDLSKAAAKELAMLRAGVVRVEVEVLKEDAARGQRTQK